MRRPTGLLLAFPAILVVILLAAVFASVVSVSLLQADPGGAVFHGPASLRNYTRLLGSADAWRSVSNTLRLSGIVTLICLVCGFPLARLLARASSARTRRMILFCLMATFFSGGVTRAYAWLIILGNRGLINQSLQALGLPSVALINNETGVVTAMLNFVLPFFVLTLFSALRTIPDTLESAARNLGASRARTFLHVTLPLSLPGVAASCFLCFALSLGAFLFPEMLGGGRVQVLATAIYDRIQTTYDVPSAAALAMLFLLLILCLLAVLGAARQVVTRRAT
ncbi:MAG: ABC transporter permease [Acidisphaera sp.]|nr:ABC transporter permease [Acidisphaera sp.]